MPFVDLSSPVQNLQGKVDPNPLSPADHTGSQQSAISNQQVSQPIIQTTTQSPNNLITQSTDQPDPSSIVQKLNDAGTMPQTMTDGRQAVQPDNQLISQSANQQSVAQATDDIKLNTGPELESPRVEMPQLVNAFVSTPPPTTPVNPVSVTGAESLPPLDEILSGGSSMPAASQPAMSNNMQATPVQSIQQQSMPDGRQAVQSTVNSNPTTPIEIEKIPSLDESTNVQPPAQQQPAQPQVTASAPVLDLKNFDFKGFNPKTATMEDFLSYTIAADASDLHMAAGSQIMVRIHGSLNQIPGDIPKNNRVEELFKQVTSEEQFKTLVAQKELDISYAHSSGNRFRINMFMTQGEWGAAFRLIPQTIKTIAELGLPDICYDFTKIPQGLIILAGPTGSGKSTSLAAMLQEINLNRAEHILTIEDPIEYVYPKAKSLVDQRELGKDTLSWKNALRAALRQDPNVVLVGEMRDHETIESTVTVAETGHLVFATLHTNSAAQTVDRIIDVFPEGQQPQIRAQLSNVLSAVISQRLIPVKSGGRKAIQEILVATTAVKNAIREGKTYQIDNIIQTSSEAGMQTLESSLIKLIRSGEITLEEAENHTVKVDELRSLLKSNN